MYIHTCIHIREHTYTCTYIHTFIDVNTYKYTCTYLHTNIHVHTNMHVHMYMYTPTCTSIHVHTYIHILNETSKPTLNIFSNILTYIIHKWLQFTLNMEKSIKRNLSKFHFHKLKLTCSIERLNKGIIAFHFHTNAKI